MIDEELLSAATDVADQTLQFCETVKWNGLSGLRSQLQRSAISVPSNIAEGIGRDGARKKLYTARGKVRFYLIAFGSLRECLIQLELLKRQRPLLTNEILSLAGLWTRVRNGMLFVIDGRSAEVHMSRGEHPPRQYAGLRELNFERAVGRAVKRALTEFLSQAKETDDISLLKSFPLRNAGATYFRLEAFRKFLEKHGRRVSRGQLTGELKSFGWNSRACRFGDKVFRVWFEPSVGGKQNKNRSDSICISPSEERILEVSGG